MSGTSLLIDYHNMSFRCFFTKEIGITTPAPDFQLWKYMMINSIYGALYKIDNVREVILAIDDSQPWRKVYFPRYKESRKKRREDTDIDWQILYNILEKYALEMKEKLPFKVLKVSRAEADDVIAILSMEVIDRDKVIISNDEDFQQLCSGKTKLYNPSKKEYIECEDTEGFIVKKSLLGQPKDDIFNIKTPSDWGLTPDTEGKRKPGYGVAALEKTMKFGWQEWLKENKLEENFKRNRILIDFRMIPKPIRGNIAKAYKDYNLASPENIYKFFKENGFRSFLEDFTKVENKLMELY